MCVSVYVCVHNLQSSVIMTPDLGLPLNHEVRFSLFYFIGLSSHFGLETGNTVSCISAAPIPEHIAG